MLGAWEPRRVIADPRPGPDEAARSDRSDAPAGDGPIDWLAGLRRRSTADLVVYALVAVVVVLALGAQPAWSVLDPALPASDAFYRQTSLPIDPWGQPWQVGER